MGDIVKYNNEMNQINFSGFTEKEINIFFSIILLAKDKGTDEISIPFAELRNLSDDDGKNRSRFIKSMLNTHSKLIKLFYKIETENRITLFTLFNRFDIDLENNILNVRINKDFIYLLNDLLENFTRFDLLDFTSLKSIYSKNIFKILKQWDNIGKKEFSLNELKKILGIENKYQKISHFDTYVLGQLRKELPKVFKSISIEKIKNGRTVTGVRFTWKKSKEKEIINYVENEEIIISSELEKAFEKASKNRFIQPFLTSDNKVELIEFFEDEKILAKGLIYAYKTINKDFKKLSYLIKVISTGAEKKNKVIVDTKELLKREKEKTREVTIEDIQNDNIRQTSFDEVNVEELFNSNNEKKEEKIKVTQSEFDKLFNDYLIENKKNFGTNLDESERKYIKSFFEKNYEIIKDKKVYTIDDIPEEKLIGKNGKKLTGGALQTRINKLLKEMNENQDD